MAVGVTSGLVSWASPISPKRFVPKLSVTVYGPCGAMSMPSSDSRWASVAGNSTVAGVGATTALLSSSTSPAAEATVSSVRRLNSLTAPVTRT